jgi:hypothetical protein
MRIFRLFCALLFFSFFFFTTTTFALTPALSEDAQITLLTASPGDELYSVFGHSAVRVKDPAQNIDLVFNYGTFDFDTPNFYVKFARGKLLYKLSVVPMEYFMAEYRFDGRAVFEQVLNLKHIEKQRIFNFMMVNSLPENAYYQYDFFYDNCATRIRDLADDILDIQWFEYPGIVPEYLAEIRSLLDYEFAYQPSFETFRSLRDMLQPFLVTMPWSAFGIDLALGLPADKVATVQDFMYLPDEMLIAFALAQHSDGRPLVTEHRILLQQTIPLSPEGFFTPDKVFWAVFILALLSFINRNISRIFDKTFFSILGITGVVILFLWFFTDHLTTKINLNILWAIPTHLYYIWVSGYLRKRNTGVLYFRIVSVLSLAMLLFWPFIPQAFNSAFFPIILTALVKSLPYAFRIPYLSDYLAKEQ